MVKKSKHKQVLERRLIDFEITMRNSKAPKGAFTKPGSLKKF
jgi:hypothetical protein